MQDDDMLYPNDGTYFVPTEPEEQVKERRANQSKAQAAKPMLEDLLASFTDDIDNLSRVASIEMDISTDSDEFMRAWFARQELIRYATQKKEYIESLLLTTKR